MMRVLRDVVMDPLAFVFEREREREIEHHCVFLLYGTRLLRPQMERISILNLNPDAECFERYKTL
jgi:hypothetical protein